MLGRPDGFTGRSNFLGKVALRVRNLARAFCDLAKL